MILKQLTKIWVSVAYNQVGQKRFIIFSQSPEIVSLKRSEESMILFNEQPGCFTSFSMTNQKVSFYVETFSIYFEFI